MSHLKFSTVLLFTLMLVVNFATAQNNISSIPIIETGSLKPMPKQWIDKDTHHMIKKIVTLEGENSSFYFHNNPFIPSPKNKVGDLMIFRNQTEGKTAQLYQVNLKNGALQQLSNRKNRFSGEIVSSILREVFYQSADSVFASNVDTGEERLVFVFPNDFKGRITTINSNGTLLAGSYALPVKDSIYKKNPKKGDYFDLIYEAKIPHWIFTLNIETKQLKKIYQEKAWLNHIQFSPTEPTTLMYCHEGPWHKVDRIWTIDVETLVQKKMHNRSMDMEIFGHEFFSRDGQKIFYDLQQPRGVSFYLASVDLKTGQRQKYKLNRNQWSIHFNISPDQKTFAGDGGDPTQVAKAPDGRWIYHFKPEGDSLNSERLVNMRHHNYRPLEPNVHFSPDGKWIIFRSDFDGSTNIYAVKIEKEKI